MLSFLRDTPAGYFIRIITNQRLCRFPETYDLTTSASDSVIRRHIPPSESGSNHHALNEIKNESQHSSDLESQPTPSPEGPVKTNSLQNILNLRVKEETESTYLEKEAKDDGDCIIVTWFDHEDIENPRNWPLSKKIWVYFVVNLMTFAVYMSAAIFVPSQLLLPSVFGISEVNSTLGIALFVLGYGFGPLLFAPMSEMPAIGRNPPYLIGMALFIIVSIPAALSSSVQVLFLMRFLQGLFGSPVLATGGASLSDVTRAHLMPYVLYSWAVFSFIAPAVGPVISGFSVPPLGWRWSLWEILFASIPVFVCLFFLPETSSSTILYRRAQRLRDATGNTNLRSEAEIRLACKSTSQVVYAALIIPWKVNALDPSILFTSLYIGLIYGIYYLFFEACPKVFIDVYKMSVGHLGLVLLAVPISVVLAGIPYFAFIRYFVDVRDRDQKPVPPESRLLPALVAAIAVPSGLFLFAWTGRADIHWAVPTIGVMLATSGMGIIIQSVFVYIALAYPEYAASLFGGNGFVKSSMACVAILVGPFLYKRLGIAGGTSLLGGLCVVCISGVFILYSYGSELRKRSRFARA